ncbi:SDR family NAD(P)-dependent oxidoreductase [Pedobacter sp. PF22-3]|uniref:SDR family oxidoreductase n=1 Tax=Pedobacter sp. PF22-3 TaxID=2994467 RepID=UPI0022479804|nr:SDR family NAD(P)-dependent oxidoreductase [Pedobacter sp. PF22-3]MCX2492842.1 SDR family NAD(P)-dependent oxidoreductase [Pedobacter sp. PF22-3]
MNITDKTILITGGGSGIGFEIAKLLSEKGNKIIIVGRTESKLQNAVEKLSNVIAVRCDINSEHDVSNLIALVTSEHPELSVLINNAGRAFAYMHDENASAFEKSTEEFATNYFSVIRLTERLLPLLKSQPEGAIVNVSSISAITPSANLPTYSDSKVALHSYTLSLRHTLAKNTSIKVFELMPPLVDTEFSKEIGGEQYGMPAEEVAKSLMDGFENDNYEIYVG